jgi:hypothetical protein
LPGASIVGSSFDLAVHVVPSSSAMKASLKSLLTYSGNSSVRNRNRKDRHEALFGTFRSARKMRTSRAPRTNGPPLPVEVDSDVFFLLALRASPLLRMA